MADSSSFLYDGIERISKEEACERYSLTRSGYVSEDGDKIAIAMPTVSGDTIRYSFWAAPLETLTAAMENSNRENAAFSLPEALTVLYKIRCGQRECAPYTMFPYIDRYNKTIFSPTYKMSITPTYKDALNAAAYMNYVFTRCWNCKYGVIRDVYREAMAIVASFAIMLMQSIVSPDSKETGNERVEQDAKPSPKNKIPSIFEDEVRNAPGIGMLQDEHNAIAFVIGCGIVGCLNTYTEGNSQNNKYRPPIIRSVHGASEIPLEQSEHDFTSEGSIKDTIGYASDTPKAIYVVDSLGEKVQKARFQSSKPKGKAPR